MHRHRGNGPILLALLILALLASMALPTTAVACLPYTAATNFSFVDSLNLAVEGRVTDVLDVGEQPHARVIVTVETIIAGTPGSTVQVTMGSDGGCTHPRGEIGDRAVVAAGAPGADYGVFSPWNGGELSPDNSATWIIGADRAIQSGPTLDGRHFATRNDLVAALRSMSNTAVATPAPSPPIVLFALALLATLSAIVGAWVWRRN